MRYESVMKLREELDKLGKLKGLTQDEKGFRSWLALLVCSYVCISIELELQIMRVWLLCVGSTSCKSKVMLLM